MNRFISLQCFVFIAAILIGVVFAFFHQWPSPNKIEHHLEVIPSKEKTISDIYADQTLGNNFVQDLTYTNDFILHGTSVSEGGDSSAYIFVKKHAVKRFYIGSDLGQGIKLSAVFRDKVILAHPTRRIVLRLSTKTADSLAREGMRNESVADEFVEGGRALNEAELEEMMANDPGMERKVLSADQDMAGLAFEQEVSEPSNLLSKLDEYELEEMMTNDPGMQRIVLDLPPKQSNVKTNLNRVGHFEQLPTLDEAELEEMMANDPGMQRIVFGSD